MATKVREIILCLECKRLSTPGVCIRCGGCTYGGKVDCGCKTCAARRAERWRQQQQRKPVALSIVEDDGGY